MLTLAFILSLPRTYWGETKTYGLCILLKIT